MSSKTQRGRLASIRVGGARWKPGTLGGWTLGVVSRSSRCALLFHLLFINFSESQITNHLLRVNIIIMTAFCFTALPHHRLTPGKALSQMVIFSKIFKSTACGVIFVPHNIYWYQPLSFYNVNLKICQSTRKSKFSRFFSAPCRGGSPRRPSLQQYSFIPFHPIHIAIMCLMYFIQKSDMHINQLWLGLWVRIKQLNHTIGVCSSANGFYRAERYILHDI